MIPTHTLNKQCLFLKQSRSRKNSIFKKEEEEAGEMAQRLRTLATLQEVPSSILSNHMVAHNHL